MHFVHVEDFFHPDAGYQVNLLSRLQRMQGHKVSIVTAELSKIPSFLTAFFGTDQIREKDARFEQETGVQVIRLPLLAFKSGRAIYKPGLVRAVDALKPDVAFIHGEDTLTGMIFIRRAAKLNYPLVLDCHMLEMASQNPLRQQFRWFYQRFITPYIIKHHIPLIRVVDSDYVEKCLGIPLSHTDLLSFGTDTLHFSPDAAARHTMRSHHNIDPDAFVVLYAGKLDESKGGLFLAQALEQPLTSSSGRPIQLVVVGNSDGEYGAQVESALARSGNSLLRLPTQRYFDLAPIYQMADLAVYPKQCSMSFFEAQSCGLPILFEDNEINAQRAEQGSARLFKPGDVADFRRQLLMLEALSADTLQAMRDRARQFVLDHYDYVPIAQQFTDVMLRARGRWQAQREAA